jgi:chromate transporter
VTEIFLAALRLGCTSFGGPVAHLAYFRRDYVERRRWISEADYAELVALCQFLPGPASSQTGFGLGYRLRGWAGGWAAWLGFTLPSAVLMVGFALGLDALGGFDGSGWLRGLKVAAVAVVAHAVLAMWRSLAPDLPRSGVVVAAAALLLVVDAPAVQVVVILGGAALGLALGRPAAAPADPAPPPATARAAALPLAICVGLLAGLPLAAHLAGSELLGLADAFMRAGALVFGGGHVVLPLLERELVAPGLVTAEQFLAGYAAAQAVPGPLFTFAGYLGTLQAGVPGGVLALVCVFLPGLLLVPATLPVWQAWRRFPAAAAAMRGANAAVVGLLLAALVRPVGTSALTDLPNAALALAAFAALHAPRVPAWAVVLACAGAGGLFGG